MAGQPVKRSDNMEHVFSRDQWNYTLVDLSGDPAVVISSVPAELGHIWVDVAMSAHACPFFDGITQVFSLPASLAAGVAVTAFKGMRFETNLQLNSNDAATGNLLVMWRPI